MFDFCAPGTHSALSLPPSPFSAVVRSVEVTTTASIPSQCSTRPPAASDAAAKAKGGDVKSVKTRLPADYELCSGCHHVVWPRSAGSKGMNGEVGKYFRNEFMHRLFP